MLKKRLLWTAVIVLAVAGALTGHIDRASEEQAQNALTNALVEPAIELHERPTQPQDDRHTG